MGLGSVCRAERFPPEDGSSILMIPPAPTPGKGGLRPGRSVDSLRRLSLGTVNTMESTRAFGDPRDGAAEDREIVVRDGSCTLNPARPSPWMRQLTSDRRTRHQSHLTNYPGPLSTTPMPCLRCAEPLQTLDVKAHLDMPRLPLVDSLVDSWRLTRAKG